MTRASVADNLAADRYRVRLADSREKALAILCAEQPDVIVVDVNGKTLDLIDGIRRGDGLASRIDPDTPLIVLTSRADELHLIRALDRGGDYVLTKPFSYPELRARIGALLRRAETRRAPRMFRAGAYDRRRWARRTSRRAAPGAARQGIRAAAHARGGTHVRLHTPGADEDRLGARHTDLPQPRQPRLPATPAPRRRRRERAADQCLGSRVPTHRPDADVVAARRRPGGRSHDGRR